MQLLECGNCYEAEVLSLETLILHFSLSFYHALTFRMKNCCPSFGIKYDHINFFLIHCILSVL